MQITTYIVNKTGLTPAALFGGAQPLVQVNQDAAGNITIPVWTVPGVAAPTAADISTALAAPDPNALANAQAAQVALLSAACQAVIVGGFKSSALGSAYSYPSTLIDQQNLIASVTASMLPGLPATWTTPFNCADSTGNWARRPHTATQIQQAGIDGMAAVLAAQAKLATFAAQVAAATTVATVQAIVWA